MRLTEKGRMIGRPFSLQRGSFVTEDAGDRIGVGVANVGATRLAITALE
jgi:hypothetical protein